MNRIAHKWYPIQDLPEDRSSLRSEELNALAQVWREQSAKLQSDASLEEFNARLRREWAIETGILEQLYDINRGVTLLLIQRGIDASLIPFDSTDRPAGEIVPILHDHEEAIQGLFDFVKKNRELSTSYIKQLHQVLTAHQEEVDARNSHGRKARIKLLRGEWKKWPNNPTRPDNSIHEYCPPEQVASEMDKLVSYHLQHIKNNVSPEVEAAWLHHRFTQIHPFMDGNGRVARCLSTLVFLRAGWFPLLIRRDDRARYIQALEHADSGDLTELVSLFVDLQKDALVTALSLSREVRMAHTDLLSAAAEKLKRRKIEEQERMRSVFDMAEKLREIAAARLDKVAGEASSALKEVDHGFRAYSQISSDENSYYFRWEILQIAKEHGYFANTAIYRSWNRLVLEAERRFEFLISFHSLGTEFSGIIASSAMTFNREPRSDDDGYDFVDLQKASERSLQFTYLENRETVERRFQEWLEMAITVALDRWQKGL